MKRPSFQFYPSDWLRDTALRTCSVGARGLWIDIICFMHEGTPYGHLKVNNKVILADNLSRMVGETLDNVKGYLRELADAGVFEYDDDGSIYSRRMVKDEIVRNARAKGGKKGGNPALMGGKVNHKDNHKVGGEVKQKTTPSSSSSSSSSSSNNKEERDATKVATPKGSRLPDDWEPTDEMIAYCKTKRPDLDYKEVAENFRDWWIAQPGQKGVKRDWAATWRTWVRGERRASKIKQTAEPWTQPGYHSGRNTVEDL